MGLASDKKFNELLDNASKLRAAKGKGPRKLVPDRAPSGSPQDKRDSVGPNSGRLMSDTLADQRRNDAQKADAQARSKPNGAGKASAVTAPKAPAPSATKSGPPAKGGTPATKPKTKGANPPKQTFPASAYQAHQPSVRSNAGKILEQMKKPKFETRRDKLARQNPDLYKPLKNTSTGPAPKSGIKSRQNEGKPSRWNKRNRG